ncbi:hypothetical protein D9757_008791 [Collybiopsis confluens]|uniref:non-reducing end alpha-L-arabinofuranosidase n=1 Tax=Collybiopsis confluens TaxID=2823264 RepID=A0A8H5H5M5_9AGAR|nr:hypothetical protein D9757_008791 [Collybiopsis confluens]
MILHGKLYLISCIFSLLPLQVQSVLAPSNALNLRITTNTTHEIPSTLYAYMWEDINHSGDGGLYAESLQNRTFQGVIPGTQTLLTRGNRSMERGCRSLIGFKNRKRLGCSSHQFGSHHSERIKVQEGWTYKGSFYVKFNTYTGSITVSLKSARGTIFASKSLTGISSSCKKFSFELKPSTSAANDDNVFGIGKRENGMRIDLAEAMAATNPTVWSFPGGNQLEGLSFDTRWKWNETIGPPENRPGRVADWSYPNTDGLGLLEYLNWAEDSGALNRFLLAQEPILGVWAGISAANYSDFADWPTIPEAGLQPYIEDVLNELEFIVGNSSTKWGQLETDIDFDGGNEDQVWITLLSLHSSKKTCTRHTDGNRSLRLLAPSIRKWSSWQPVFQAWLWILRINSSTFINTTHRRFEENAFFFDSYPRNGTKWFIGEYAVTSTNDSNALGSFDQGRLQYPTLAGAAAEAAFMTGMGRNSYVVRAQVWSLEVAVNSEKPALPYSLQHIRDYQWTPDIISFDASRVVKSTSYHVQQMFSTNRGTQVLATLPASDANSVPLYWVASYNNETHVVFLKLSNTGTDDLVGDITLDFTTSGFATAISLNSPVLSPISGLFNISNTIEEPESIIPSFSFQNPTRYIPCYER